MAMSLTNNPLVNYVRESKDELKKVVWPSRKIVVRDTIIVVSISLVMAAFFGAADFGLSTGFQKLIEYVALRG
jgi:preprotein translocase subunit SecE